jgi:hypothetical protein
VLVWIELKIIPHGFGPFLGHRNKNNNYKDNDSSKLVWV